MPLRKVESGKGNHPRRWWAGNIGRITYPEKMSSYTGKTDALFAALPTHVQHENTDLVVNQPLLSTLDISSIRNLQTYQEILQNTKRCVTKLFGSQRSDPLHNHLQRTL